MFPNGKNLEEGPQVKLWNIEPLEKQISSLIHPVLPQNPWIWDPRDTQGRRTSHPWAEDWVPGWIIKDDTSILCSFTSCSLLSAGSFVCRTFPVSFPLDQGLESPQPWNLPAELSTAPLQHRTPREGRFKCFYHLNGFDFIISDFPAHPSYQVLVREMGFNHSGKIQGVNILKFVQSFWPFSFIQGNICLLQPCLKWNTHTVLGPSRSIFPLLFQPQPCQAPLFSTHLDSSGFKRHQLPMEMTLSCRISSIPADFGSSLCTGQVLEGEAASKCCINPFYCTWQWLWHLVEPSFVTILGRI